MQSRDQQRALTKRQLRLIELVTRGLQNKEIAAELGVSEQAVKEGISGLLVRLEVRNRAALAELGTRAAILGAPVASADWLPFLFRDAPISIAFLRGRGHVIEVMNDAGRRAAGNREVTGEPFAAVFPEASPALMSLLDDVFAGGAMRVMASVMNRWDRHGTGVTEYGLMDVVVQPIRSPAGEVSGLLLYAVDVTDARVPSAATK